MLRSTYSRIKSICSVALVPRILRPDQCFLPGKFEKLKNEDSPVLSRSFFKTEWTKPKFDLTKPYVDSRPNCETTKIQHKETPAEIEKLNCQARKVIRNSQNVRNFSTTVQCDDIKITTKKLIKHGNTFNLNLERLLLPPMASVSYVIARHYATKKGKDDKESNDVFWRPLDRVPTEEEWNKRATDPKMKKAMEKEARYLLLSFDNMELAKPDPKVQPRPRAKKEQSVKENAAPEEAKT